MRLSRHDSDGPVTPHVVVLGELLLRLKAPGHERLLQSNLFEATFGGAEANVACALAMDGISTSIVTAVPPNAIGDAAIAEMRRFGVGTEHVAQRAGRMGTYYLEAGAGPRPGRVIYDREHSAFALLGADDIDWNHVLQGATWFHVSGITPAVSSSCASMCLHAVTVARRLGLTVSCDYNYRAQLWNYGRRAPEVMREIVAQAHIGIAGRSDCQTVLGIEPHRTETEGVVDGGWYRELAAQTLETFPNLDVQIITLRDGESASHYRWSACSFDRREFRRSPTYEIEDVVDRVGAGDAFTAGYLHAMLAGHDAQFALDFATAAGCLKHTIVGDVNRVRAEEVMALMRGEGGGRIRR